jgi:hypothetical protein
MFSSLRQVELAQCINCRDWALKCRAAIDEHHDACLQVVAAAREKYAARTTDLKRRLQALTYENRTSDSIITRLEGECAHGLVQSAGQVQYSERLAAQLEDKTAECQRLQEEIQALKRHCAEMSLKLEAVNQSAEIAKRTAAQAGMTANMLRHPYGSVTDDMESTRRAANAHASAVARLHLEIDVLKSKSLEAVATANEVTTRAEAAVQSRDAAYNERDDAVKRWKDALIAFKLVEARLVTHVEAENRVGMLAEEFRQRCVSAVVTCDEIMEERREWKHALRDLERELSVSRRTAVTSLHNVKGGSRRDWKAAADMHSSSDALLRKQIDALAEENVHLKEVVLSREAEIEKWQVKYWKERQDAMPARRRRSWNMVTTRVHVAEVEAGVHRVNTVGVKPASTGDDFE